MARKDIVDIAPQEGLVDETLEELRKKLAGVCGVTLQGNRLTVRWSNPGGGLKLVHMVILEVDDGEEEEEEEEDEEEV